MPGPHVEVHGGDGPPLLLVHGIMAGRALWAANLERLRTVCTPVVLELYGHGRSPAPGTPGPYAPDAYVERFEQVRQRLAIDRWLLFGHSLGAAMTLRYALAHPDRVIGHGFSNSASALAGASWRQRVEATADDEADRIVRGGLAALRDHPLNPARSRHVVASVRRELAADVDLLDPAGIATTIRQVARASSLRERIRDNVVPCLLVAGDREAGFAEPCRHAEAVMPQLTTVHLDAGHSPNAEAPAAFDDALTAFVSHLA